jgi:hypothetical protein
MVAPDDAGRAGGNGWVTLQSRYGNETVSKGFRKRTAPRLCMAGTLIRDAL